MPPFRLTLPPDPPRHLHGVWLPPLVPHQFEGGGAPHLFLLIEPASGLAQRLQQQHPAPAGAAVPMDPGAYAPLLALAHAPCPDPLPALRQHLHTLLGDAPLPSPDPRIRAVQHYIRQHLHLALRLPQLAAVAQLSGSRLAHLFAQQVGMPLRSYIRWQRMRSALQAVQAGHNLTTAAHAAGFADSAHFSRTFARMFGTTPSALRAA